MRGEFTTSGRVPLVAGILVLCMSVSGNSASLKSIATKENKTIISVSGEIIEGDADAFRQAIQRANDSGKLVSGIRLNSPGGLLIEAVKLADLVRFAKVATSVPNGSTCASACFLVFAAGSNKYASYTAQIGVHGASGENGKETIGSGAATVTMARIVKELGVPASIIGKMVVTPPDQMLWLTPDELRSMGATMTGKPTQVAAPPATTDPGPLPLSPEARAGLPPQTAPTPSQVPPQPQPKAKLSWSQMVDYASTLSAQQNNGRPKTTRVCQPELKSCVTGIWYNYEGQDWLIKKTDSISGATVSREMCVFNEFGDIRTCFDFDSGRAHRDMKNAEGQWVGVDNQ